MKSLIGYNHMLKKLKALVLCSFMMLIPFSTIVFAQVNPAERIQAEQQILIEEEFRRRELENALKRPDVKEKIEKEDKIGEELKPSTCINIKEVHLLGNEVLSSKIIQKEISKHKNKCLSLPEIDLLLQGITNLYLNKGYVTSRAYMKMPQKQLKNGILEVTIVEGKISKIEGLKKGEKITAFPFLVDEALNIRDIEQGLDQINRLGSNQAKMDIKADTEKNNYSNVVIENNKKGRVYTTSFIDNAGSESTGETRLGLRSSFDNIFNINDQISMSYTKSPSKDRHNRDSNSLTLGASIPFGYWTLNNNFSWSNYMTSFVLVNGDKFHSFGRSLTNDTSLERLISRGQKHKLSASAGFLYKSNKNFSKVLDYKTKNTVSSRDLTILHFSLPTTFYTNNGVVYLKPSYNQGIRAFDGLRDKDYNYSQKAQYQAYKLYGYYSNYFGKVSFTSSFDGQYSKDELFGSEAFMIGGEYTVRGFKEDSVQGDSGFTIRNDAKINLAHAFSSDNQILGAFTPGVFLDYGYVDSNHKYIKDEQLAGAGVGLDMNYKFFEGRVSYAKPLHRAKGMEENEAIYLYAGASFRF